MSEPQQVPPEIVKAVPGALGSIIALRWVVGTWQQRLSAFVGGSATSYYGADHATRLTGMDSGFAGFLLGLFGMAIAGKLFEALAALDVRARLDKLLRKVGL